MGGGPSKSEQNMQTSIAQQQLSEGQQLINQSSQQYAQKQQFQAPLASFLQSIIGGDRGAAETAEAPIISNITGGFQKSKDQIMNTVPEGAARDFALSQLPVQMQSAVSGTRNNLFTNALSTLASMGDSSGNYSLQAAGGGLSGLSGAGNTNNQLMTQQAQAKATTMGFLGSLAGAAASPFAGKH